MMKKQIEWIKEGRIKGKSWDDLRYGKVVQKLN